VIYDPVRDDLYTASKGQGAQRNDRKIRVNQQKLLSECLIGMGFPCRMKEIIDPYFDTLKSIGREVIGLRRAGSAALDLAYVASGQLDGFWEAGLKPWDMAAGMLMIKEAGGLVGDFSGAENSMTNGEVIAGNPKIFKALLSHIKQYF
jgi:myo-inositol-1(or 4)-monophosphatase